MQKCWNLNGVFVLVVDVENFSGKSDDFSVVAESEKVGRDHHVRLLQRLLPQNFFDLEKNITFEKCNEATSQVINKNTSSQAEA